MRKQKACQSARQKSVEQKSYPKHHSKICYPKTTKLEVSSKKYCKKADQRNSSNLKTEKQSTVVLSKERRRIMLPKTPSKIRVERRQYMKARLKNCSGMLPETPLEIAIYERTYQKDQQKSNVQERCQRQHRQTNAIRN